MNQIPHLEDQVINRYIKDITKAAGHTNPTMLRKYIKADEQEVVEKITDKYDYFD